MRIFNLAEELEKERIKNKELEEKIKELSYINEKQLLVLENAENILDKIKEDLEKTKKYNKRFQDKYGNELINVDIDHIEYLLNILKGEE